jgi:transcriptional regulator with XRE-family HTH domain
MTSAEYRDVLDLLALTQAQMAELLGVSIRTAHGYANGARIPEPVARLLALTLSLYERGRPARIEARP